MLVDQLLLIKKFHQCSVTYFWNKRISFGAIYQTHLRSLEMIRYRRSIIDKRCT